MRRTWVFAIALAACGGGKGMDVARTAQVDLGAVRVTTYSVVRGDRVSGSYQVTTGVDGTTRTQLRVLENGRGPTLEATLRLGADWTPEEFAASGSNMLGTAVDEKFRVANGVGRWKSTAEHGEAPVTGPTFYLPMADGPLSAFLVPAALKAGGTLALLPAGRLHVEKVAEFTVTKAGEARVLDGYRMTGLALAPVYTWFSRADGAWFADVSAFESTVLEGWTEAIAPIRARQKELERAYDATLAGAAATRAKGFALTNARVLDVERGAWIANQTVVVVGDKITAIGKTGSVAIPPGVETVAVAGSAVLPGLVDMHAHMDTTGGVLDIASGVTTARDLGNIPDELDELSRRFDMGTAVGPRVVRYGMIEGRGEKAAAAAVTAETPDEAKAAVAEFVKRGYAGIKIYNSIKPELVPVLTGEAHAHGLRVTGHVPAHMLAHQAIAAGFDGIEHVNMLLLNFLATTETDTRDTSRFTLVGEGAHALDLASAPVAQFIAQLRDKRIVVAPTLAVFEDLFVGAPGVVTPGLEATVARFPATVRRTFLLGGLPMSAETRATYAKSWAKILELVKALAAAKVPLVLGTDHMAGVMLHHEMELFVRAGIAPADVLRMATIEAARALQLEASIGSIAVGKRADLVVVQGDPLARITDIRRTQLTLRGGVLYRSAALHAALGVAP